MGNARHGIALPYNDWTRPQWLTAFRTIGLGVREWKGHPRLYPVPAKRLFERHLHFVAKLGV